MLKTPYILNPVYLQFGDKMRKKRKKETETMDICNEKQREEMLKSDEITELKARLWQEEKENLGRRKRIYGWKRKRRRLLNWLKRTSKRLA